MGEFCQNHPTILVFANVVSQKDVLLVLIFLNPSPTTTKKYIEAWLNEPSHYTRA
jgi:hypothetical protein